MKPLPDVSACTARATLADSALVCLFFLLLLLSPLKLKLFHSFERKLFKIAERLVVQMNNL